MKLRAAKRASNRCVTAPAQWAPRIHGPRGRGRARAQRPWDWDCPTSREFGSFARAWRGEMVRQVGAGAGGRGSRRYTRVHGRCRWTANDSSRDEWHEHTRAFAAASTDSMRRVVRRKQAHLLDPAPAEAMCQDPGRVREVLGEVQALSCRDFRVETRTNALSGNMLICSEREIALIVG